MILIMDIILDCSYSTNMASANYANNDDNVELNLVGLDRDKGKTVMERDMTPLVKIDDHDSLASDWSEQVEEEEASGAGQESLRESEHPGREAEGFERTTEGGGEDDVSTVDSEAVVDIEDSVGGTSGAGVGDLESACQDSGKVQSTVQVTYQQYLKSWH